MMNFIKYFMIKVSRYKNLKHLVKIEYNKIKKILLKKDLMYMMMMIFKIDFYYFLLIFLFRFFYLLFIYNELVIICN